MEKLKKPELLKEAEKLKQKNLELEKTNQQINFELSEAYSAIKALGEEKEQIIEKTKKYLADDSVILELQRGYKPIGLMIHDITQGDYVITVQRKDGTIERGYGRTLQKAYNMACAGKYNPLNAQYEQELKKEG